MKTIALILLVVSNGVMAQYLLDCKQAQDAAKAVGYLNKSWHHISYKIRLS